MCAFLITFPCRGKRRIQREMFRFDRLSLFLQSYRKKKKKIQFVNFDLLENKIVFDTARRTTE